MTRQAERTAHISSALGLRRTAHDWMKLARKFPDEADQYKANATYLRNYARWQLSMVRNIDAMEEWRETQ